MERCDSGRLGARPPERQPAAGKSSAGCGFVGWGIWLKVPAKLRPEAWPAKGKPLRMRRPAKAGLFPSHRLNPQPTMKHAAPFLLALLGLVLLSGCQTEEEKAATATRTAMNDAIKNEPPGNYYIGRRYYKVDYKFWGYIRKPGQPWSTAKLVMMNEQKMLAPDRAKGTLGSDHGYEYKLSGDYLRPNRLRAGQQQLLPRIRGHQLRIYLGHPAAHYPDPRRQRSAAPDHRSAALGVFSHEFIHAPASVCDPHAGSFWDAFRESWGTGSNFRAR